MGDVNVKEVRNIDPVEIQRIDNIAPVTIDSIRQVEAVAPIAVHIKELNQVDPLLIDSLRIDAVRNLDPLQVEELNVTRLPVVNLSVNQVPNVGLDVRRIPPVSIGVHQTFDMPSSYTARAEFLGFEVLRIHLQGRTRIVPRDCARREQAHAHERSFPEVAAVGNPAIPSFAEGCSGYAPRKGHRHAGHGISVGTPRYSYGSARRPGVKPG
jgi:hypothetical protein